LIEIRSYRRVFDLERRIYRLDRLRLNPGGVPVRGIVYFLAIVAAAVALRRLPLLGELVGAPPWYLSDLLLPAALAALLCLIRVEGRPFHLAAHALARYVVSARWTSGLERCAAPGHIWRPGRAVILPDGSESRMRHLRYTGPGAVLVAVRHERPRPAAGGGLVRRPPPVLVRELPGWPASGRVLALGSRARLRTRPMSRERG
jgi:hypothetical protein